VSCSTSPEVAKRRFDFNSRAAALSVFLTLKATFAELVPVAAFSTVVISIEAAFSADDHLRPLVKTPLPTKVSSANLPADPGHVFS